MTEIDPKYRTGIAQIDREHLRLFEIIDEVEGALSSADSQSDGTEQHLQHAIGELVDYTRTHFASEEGLMLAANYPKLIAHRELHVDLLRQADDMSMRVELGDESAILDLSRFLADWLVNHILSADREFARFVLEKTPSGS